MTGLYDFTQSGHSDRVSIDTERAGGELLAVRLAPHGCLVYEETRLREINSRFVLDITVFYRFLDNDIDDNRFFPFLDSGVLALPK